MAPRKTKATKKKALKKASQPTSPNIDGSPTDGFNAGVASTSSPVQQEVDPYAALHERERLALKDLEEETIYAKNALATRYDTLIASVKPLGRIIYIVDESQDKDIMETIGRLIRETKAQKAIGESHNGRNPNVNSTFNVVSNTKTSNMVTPFLKRRSRSVELGGQPQKLYRCSSGSRGFAGFVTPSTTQTFKFAIATVTPHPRIKRDPPMIRRQAQPGELAVSMTGSPLLVPSGEMSPNLNIPLSNGRVYNFVATDGLEDQPLPGDIDPGNLEKLRTLRNFLNKNIN